MYLETQKLNWRLVDKTDELFVDLANALDNLEKQRVVLGMGVIKSADLVSAWTMEDIMWNTGENKPGQLSDTVLYLLGVNLALGGTQKIKVSWFQ